MQRREEDGVRSQRLLRGESISRAVANDSAVDRFREMGSDELATSTPRHGNQARGQESTCCYHLMMARTVTLRLSDSVYEAVKRYAGDDQKSMNSWIGSLLDVEDMRRRCDAHDRWMQDHPEAATFSEAWADQNLDELMKR